GSDRLRAESSAFALGHRAPPRMRQLALGAHDREPRARQPQRSLVQQVAGLPAREELRVETVEALYLEEGVAKRYESPQEPVHPPARTVHNARQGCEVERDLLDPAPAQR